MYFIQSILQIFFPVIFSTSPLLLFSCYFFSRYFFSCYFFSYFPTVTFFRVTFFPVTFFPLLFFLLLSFLHSSLHPVSCTHLAKFNYSGVMMSAIASQITGVSNVCSAVCSAAKKTSKLSVTGICEGNSPVTGEFPAQRASNVENVSIWWRHHVITYLIGYWILTKLQEISIGYRYNVVQYNMLFHTTLQTFPENRGNTTLPPFAVS